MKTHKIQKVFWLFGILLLLSLAFIVKGCERERKPSSPEKTQLKEIYLTMAKPFDSRAKATGCYIKAVGVMIGEDQVEKEIGPTIGPIEITEDLTFPLSMPFTVLVPPCLYRFTWGVMLVREPDRKKSAVFNVCETGTLDLSILTFEDFRIYENPIQIYASDPVKAGERLDVSCGTTWISAPDSDRWPLTAELWEEGKNGQMINGIKGPFDTHNWLSGSFPDPFPLSSFEEQRVFKCFIEDGRSPSETFEKTIQRIPPCLVQNENDSGPGSLRQVLADAPANGCTTIRFASGVSTITLTSGQLTVPAMTVTIDGGSGVIVSGNNSSRVFSVSGTTTDVTFDNLTIRDGSVSGSGGGISIVDSTVTIGSGTTVTNNNVNSGNGGGIFVRGVLTMNGVVSNNSAPNGVFGSTGYGGGICAFGSGTQLILNGTVSNNSARFFGGGIWLNNDPTFNCNAGAMVNNANSAINGGGLGFGGNPGTNNIDCTVSGNTATEYGGGIYSEGGAVNIATPGASGNVSGNTGTYCNNYYLWGAGGCQW